MDILGVKNSFANNVILLIMESVQHFQEPLHKDLWIGTV